ncbi:hypothetical protein [Methylobacterium oryzae]|uniref:hypothetical protein n=1 Tax=Methylobacterium oryzae TaxID=334852 RepID=UPI002F3452A6
MSTAAIIAVAACALIGWCALVQSVKEVLVARAQPPACPCRDVQSLTLTPGSVFELPPGANLTTRFDTVGADNVRAAFGDVARTLKKGH